MAPHSVEITDSTFDSSTVDQSAPRKRICSILKVRGTEIVDGDGEPVILKGVGFWLKINPRNSSKS
jgi:hypothetical protein